MRDLRRRDTFRLLGAGTLATMAAGRGARAEDKVLAIGMSFPLTGSLALQAGMARDAAVYAIDEVGRASLDGVLFAKELGGEGDG